MSETLFFKSNNSCKNSYWRKLLPVPNVAKLDRKSTRLNSSHSQISYAVFCLKKKKEIKSGLSADGVSANRQYLPLLYHLTAVTRACRLPGSGVSLSLAAWLRHRHGGRLV